MIQNLLIATTNKGKIKEITDLLGKLPIDLLTPDDLNLQLEVDENGSTYFENAHLKAEAYCQAGGLPTLADDTGLEVAALGGKPGLYSARFSENPNATNHDRRQLLLAKLAEHQRPWEACFICVVVLALPNGEIYSAEGICPGEIIPDERGNQGFGYDPIFLLDDAGKTMAELSLREKNRISHRALAVRGIIPIVEKLSQG